VLAQLAATGAMPEIIDFVGDDETPFVKAAIPAGGAENGDRRENRGTGRGLGGRTGEAYDECSHMAYDRLENVNGDVLDHYLRALAGTVAHLATSSEKPAG
jgi:aminopeptidase S